MKYLPRIIDKTLKDYMNALGGVIITGPKDCGKTETAKQICVSRINLQTDESAKIYIESDPKQILVGASPRLIDEWQVFPKIRDYARHEIDERKSAGQFILTGSATPSKEDEQNLHSGAGRFAKLKMRTMTWSEMGWSDGSVSLREILDGKKVRASTVELPLNEIARRVTIGGWPILHGKSEKAARIANRSYIDNIIDADIHQVDKVMRDPARVRKAVESYARNIATAAKVTTIASDISGAEEDFQLDPDTIRSYLNALERLMIIEDLPIWNTHIRSSAKLRVTPKRHFTDPSLAVAALNLSSDLLLKEPKYLGFVFESAVVHDLRVYAEQNDAEVYYYLDSADDEVDAIVEQRGGKFAIFEVKLGLGSVDEAVMSLNKFVEKLPESKRKDLMSMNVIVGNGVNITRQDGVNVISLASLGV
jgi:predicted AAA+ superfamily ATPase